MRDSARNLFVSRGYANTTMAQISDAAEVAVQTLYYSFQSKGKLLIEIVEVVAAGGEPAPLPVAERQWFRQMMSVASPQRILALAVEHGTDIYERVADLWPVIETALSDPDVAQYWERVATGRRSAHHGMVVRLAELQGLKPGLEVQRATDLLFLLAGHDPYRCLVQGAGWSSVEYRSWLFSTLVEQLLDASAVEPAAIADLSFADAV